MQFSLWVVLFWCGIFTLVGIAIGSVIERRFGKVKPTIREEVLPPAIPPARSAAYGLNRTGDVAVVRAWRNRAGRVWLEMDGARLEDASALQSEQRHRLLNLVLELRPWLESTPAAAPETSAVPIPKPAKTAAASAEEKYYAAGMHTIPEQIDALLQAKLAASALKGRAIRVYEAPGGMVMVQDGANKYEGVDSVPDPDMKALIRQAVADWERSTR